MITLAERFVGHEDVSLIGRGSIPRVAMEGSLKMKEISYIPLPRRCPLASWKHGTLALITEGDSVIVVLIQRDTYDKTVSAIQEVKARCAQIAIAYEGDSEVLKHADEACGFPRCPTCCRRCCRSSCPIAGVSRCRGERHDIDQPRNLAKSVTVE